MNLLKIRINGVEKLVKYEPYESIKIDGRKYRIVQIGRQWWMAENLDYAWEGLPTTGGHSANTAYAMYPDNNETIYGYDGKRYGLMYNFTAMRYLVSNTSAFPENWHVPTQAELTKLVDAAGGDSVAGGKLKSSTKYDGTDDYGFSMVPAGLYYNGTTYDTLENDGFIWAAEQYNSNSGYTKKFAKGSDSVTIDDPAKAAFNSIRLCKDATVSIGGKDYPTTRIGNQVWLAENLDLKWDGLTVGESGTSSEEPRANYYNNDEATYGVNGNKYGLLYNWLAAKYIDDHKKELLPKGWHVPTLEEWNMLATEIGGLATAGIKLRSSTGWSNRSGLAGGTDDYGFTSLPTGAYDGNFVNNDWCSMYWGATLASTGLANNFVIDRQQPLIIGEGYIFGQFSIRLVKDIH